MAATSETLLVQQLLDAQARISELEQALAQADETHNLFRIMVDAIPARLFWKDTKLTYLGANRKFAEDAGLSAADQIIGKSDYELGWKDQAELYRADDWAVISSGIPKINFEEPQTTPDGGRMWLETSKIPLHDASGTLIGVMGTYSDITPRKRDQQALIESETRTRAIIAALPDTVFVVKRDGTVVEFYAPQESDLYVPPEQIVGTRINETLPPPIAANLLNFISTALDTNRVQRYEYSLPLPKGEAFFEARLSAATNDTTVVVVRNVTDQKHAEIERERFLTQLAAQNEQLERALSLQKATFEATADGILAVDTQGKVVVANQRFAQMWHISDEILALGDDNQLLGSVLDGLKNPEEFISTVKEMYGKPTETLHDFLNLKDGRVFERYSQPQNMGDRVVGRVWNFRDITVQRQAEEKVQRLASIIEQTSDFVASTFSNNELFYVNPAGRKMIGLSPDHDLAGVSVPDFTPDWTLKLIAETVLPALFREGVWTGETAFVDQAGNETPLSQTFILQTNPDGSRGTISTIARDISEQKRAEAERIRLIEELQVANRIARESSRAKSEFLATMSHELRTPLNAIIGFSDMLLAGMSGPLNDKQRHKVERLKDNSTRLLGLINDLLDLTRIEAGRVEIVQKSFAPRTLVERLAAQMESLSAETKLEFKTVISPTLPALVIGDEKRIEQVILNLVSNAFKFTEKGSVTLELAPSDNMWSIVVTDTGIGVPPHAQNLIFEAFRQVDGSFSRTYQGSGLGLAITRDLVRMMDGKISVKSTLGAGSTFTVLLPLNAPALEAHNVAELTKN